MIKYRTVITMNTTILNTLNENQKEAATTIDQHVRIVAGAGSGKTRVLMTRIAYLVNEVGVLPSRILAITFTNKAANEMKERLHAQLGEEANWVRISTIHSLCVRMLREDAMSVGYPSSFTILDPDDQKSILRPYYKQYEIDRNQLPVSKVISAISAFKFGQVSVDEAKKMAMNQEQTLVADLYGRYEAKRKEMKSMDFDDLLLEANRLLKSSQIVREKWQNRLDYIHVDEFQDVDYIQYEIVRLLTGPHCKLCVVGDPDQTIYTWRGASVDIILRFNQDFSNCKTVILNENYRSTQPILNASNALIANNTKRIKKELYSNISGNDLIEIHESMEDKEEPIYIARQIVEHHKAGYPYSDMAILYRSNYSSRSFEKIFRSVNIPYRIYGGVRFYERQEIKDILSYLKLCTKPSEDDPEQFALDLAVLRVLNVPRRGIGARTIEKLQDQAAKRHLNLYEVLKDPQDCSTAITRKLDSFVELIEDLKKERETHDLQDFLDIVVTESGYEQMLKENHEEDRLENVKELKEDISQAMIDNPDTTLESYLQDIALFTDKTQEAQDNAISLMTVHAAKGLEFPIVFIVNMNEGIFPSARAIEDSGKQGLEEERRLMYVAMTRAKKYLTISYNKGYSYMLETFKTASRFLKEIPDEFTHNAQKEERMKAMASHKTNVVHRRESTVSKRNAASKVKLRKGDIVEHSIYGQGVILEVRDAIATIAFGHQYGVKKMNALHPSLKKI